MGDRKYDFNISISRLLFCFLLSQITLEFFLNDTGLWEFCKKIKKAIECYSFLKVV